MLIAIVVLLFAHTCHQLSGTSSQDRTWNEEKPVSKGMALVDTETRYLAATGDPGATHKCEQSKQ